MKVICQKWFHIFPRGFINTRMKESYWFYNWRSWKQTKDVCFFFFKKKGIYGWIQRTKCKNNNKKKVFVVGPVSCCCEINLDRTEATDMQTGVGYKAAERHSHRLALDGGNSELPCKLHDKQTEKQQHMFTGILLPNQEECQEWSDIGRQTYLRKSHEQILFMAVIFRNVPSLFCKFWHHSAWLTEVNTTGNEGQKDGHQHKLGQWVHLSQTWKWDSDSDWESQCGSVFSQLSTSWRSPGPPRTLH